MNNIRNLNSYLIGLVFFTLAAIYLQEYSLNHVYVIDAKTNWHIEGVSDGSINSGKSVAKLVKSKDSLVLDCEIIASEYGWPFCEISIFTHDATNEDQKYGLDLSLYQEAHIFMKQENLDKLGVRFHIRNYNPAYASVDEQNTWKYNAIAFNPVKQGYPAVIPLNTLQVATWWLAEQNVPLSHSGAEFNNVMQIELVTGHYMTPAKYMIELEKIEFHGKQFSTKRVYFFILSVWVLSAIVLILIQFSLSHRALVTSKKSEIALKRRNKLLNIESEELKNKVDRDPLTGALNRAGIDPILTSDLRLVSLIFIDIDHFKRINDVHGHNTGDQVLRDFSALLSQNSRGTDFLARWGGEEFLLVCPNSTVEHAEILAEALRETIECHQWPENLKITSSFGVAQRAQEESYTEFINRADKALYNAKAQGRNRVVCSV